MSTKLLEYKKNIKNTFKISTFMLKFVWKERLGKVYILLKTIESLLNTVSPLIYVLFPGMLINELSIERRISVTTLYVCIIVGLPFLMYLLNTCIGAKIYKLELELNLKFNSDFYHHITTMDYETLENPNVQIQKDRTYDTICQSLTVVNHLCSIISQIVGLIAVLSVISTLNLLFIVLIIVITYINSRLLKRTNEQSYEMSKNLSKFDRLAGAYIYKLNNFEYAKEIRLFDLSEYLLTGFKKVYNEKNHLTIKQHMVGRKIGILTSALNLVQQLVMYIYILYKVLFRNMSIGDMTIYTGITSQFTGVLNRLTGTYLSLSRMSLDVNEMMVFYAIEPHCKSGNRTPIFDSNSIIEFRNVSFRYPGNDRYAIQNLNFTIRGDEKLCIVGLNGAGKTTFLKLLTRLYLPESGDIFLNGININEYDYKKYLKLFAPVFQDYKIYNMLTLGKNVVLTSKFDKNKLDKLCLFGGLNPLLNKLSKKYDSIPSKYIDEEGFEPSGGEGQRIAITRACYRGGEVFLLDEPTASLDPMAEYEIYTQFNNMIADKCAILITHRLSAVQLADKVAVFDNGNVVEHGTHEELYAYNGLYTEMFDKQAQFYREDHTQSTNME